MSDEKPQYRTDPEGARQFIAYMQERIIHEELPVLVPFLLNMIHLLQKANDRLQLEVLAQGDLILESTRIGHRVANKMHQLMNTKPLLALLEQHVEVNGADRDDDNP